MNKNFWITLLIICSLQAITAQNNSDILIIDSKHDISISTDAYVKEISIPRGLIKKTRKSLLQQCIDSTRFYNGNCFIVTYYNDNEFVIINKGQDSSDYMRGKIYSLDESEFSKIGAKNRKHKITKSNYYHFENDASKKDS